MTEFWLCCLFVAGLEGPVPFKPAAPAVSLKLPTIVFALAAAADIGVTHVGLRTGRQKEVNIFLKHLDSRPVATTVVAVAADVVGVYAWNRFVGRRWPKVARAGLLGSAIFRFVLAAWGFDLNRFSERLWSQQCAILATQLATDVSALPCGGGR